LGLAGSQGFSLQTDVPFARPNTEVAAADSDTADSDIVAASRQRRVARHPALKEQGRNDKPESTNPVKGLHLRKPHGAGELTITQDPIAAQDTAGLRESQRES
jgi:hypothetical protein